MPLPKRDLKVAMIGGGGVGKSALTVMFVQNQFLETYDPTIGKALNVDNDWTPLSILDTAGQEEYRALRDQHFRNSDGFIYVYSLTSRKTLEEIQDMHEQMLRVKDIAPEKVPIVLAGNKVDLPDEREVHVDLANSVAAKICPDLPYFECSAKERINVDEIFVAMVKQLRLKCNEPERTKKTCNLL